MDPRSAPKRPAAPQRRGDDRRIASIDKSLDTLTKRVDEIRDMLISEPEASPLGRGLLSRSEANRRRLEEIDRRLVTRERFDLKQMAEDIESLQNWKAEWRGSWRLVTGVATILGIIGAFFGVLAYISPHP